MSTEFLDQSYHWVKFSGPDDNKLRFLKSIDGETSSDQLRTFTRYLGLSKPSPTLIGLNHEINHWLEEQGYDYELALVEMMTYGHKKGESPTGEKSLYLDKNFYVGFKDPDHSMLFKLTWS